MSRIRFSLLAFLAVPLFFGCTARSLELPSPNQEAVSANYYPQTLEKDVDLLFVIDNSQSMATEQRRLRESFPNLIDALISPKLGNELPNIRIGVISTDLGAGNWGHAGCEIVNGDNGELQSSAVGASGCPTPSDAWIESNEGNTNIQNCSKSDYKECVKDSFSCIAGIGISGCGFEMPLEAARRALDEGLNINPGFIREDALLAVVFITDEDDCSARSAELFNPTQSALTDTLGPLTSFRCFEFGVSCDINDRTVTGVRKDCVPSGDKLYRVEDYINFFEKLKGSKDRVIMAAITGPTPDTTPSGDVIVEMVNEKPSLHPSCTFGTGDSKEEAVPAIRIMSVIDAFDGQFASICQADKFGEALSALGTKIVASLGGQCISSPLLLPNGGIACSEGVSPCKMPSCDTANGETCDTATGYCVKDGKTLSEKYCGSSCLDKVDCIINEVLNRGTDNEVKTEIPKCPADLFNDTTKAKSECGANCPCWRLVPRSTDDCDPTQGVPITPFGLEIMRTDEPQKGAEAEARCRSATYSWMDDKIQNAQFHCTAPTKD